MGGKNSPAYSTAFPLSYFSEVNFKGCVSLGPWTDNDSGVKCGDAGHPPVGSSYCKCYQNRGVVGSKNYQYGLKTGAD